MKLLALLALIASIPATAATQILNCPPSGTPFYKVAAPSNALSSKLSLDQNKAFCNLPSKYPDTTTYISVTTNGGNTWTWVTLKSMNLGSSSATIPTPPTNPVVMISRPTNLSWSPTTKNVDGTNVAGVITYTIYRGPTANTLVKIGTSMTNGYQDVVNGVPPVSAYYAVTATSSLGMTESNMSPVSGFTITQDTVGPIPPGAVVAK